VRAFFDIVADIWDSGQKGQAEQASLIKAELAQAERKSGQLMERLIAADSEALIAAYEKQCASCRSAGSSCRTSWR